MKSIRLKILAMLAIVAGGAILSAIISIYGLQKADDLNSRSQMQGNVALLTQRINCLLYTSPSPRDGLLSRMPSSA